MSILSEEVILGIFATCHKGRLYSQDMAQGVSHRNCKVLQRGDGYGYSLVAKKDATGTPPKPRNAAHSTLCLTGLKAEVSRTI